MKHYLPCKNITRFQMYMIKLLHIASIIFLIPATPEKS